jgi:D-alanine-D-alanine ligase
MNTEGIASFPSYPLLHQQSREDERRGFSELLATVRQRTGQIFIAVCANTKGLVSHADYCSGFSVESEYLSQTEHGEIMSALRENGLLAASFSESEMMSFILSGEFEMIPKAYRFVYSTRGSGIHPLRSCTIPRLCESNEIATCSANARSLALAANKFETLKLLQAYGLPVPKFWLFQQNGVWLDSASPQIGQYVIAKPCYESASIGIDHQSVSFYSRRFDLLLRKRSQQLLQPIIVQQFVSGYEVEVPIICSERKLSTPAIGISLQGLKLLEDRILDYAVVYDDDYEFYEFDEIDPILARGARQIAITAATVLGLRGLCRIDFRIQLDGQTFITDVNALPHLTQHSSCHRGFQAVGLTYRDLLCMLAECGMRACEKQAEARSHFE